MSLYDLTQKTADYEAAQAKYLAAIEAVERARLAWHTAGMALRHANGYDGNFVPGRQQPLTLEPFKKEASVKATRAAAPAPHGVIHFASHCAAALRVKGIRCRSNGNDLYVAAADKATAVEVLTGVLDWNWHAADSMLWRDTEPREEVYIHKELP